MANFNRVILIGNLTRDPQLKYLPSQTAGRGFWAGDEPQVQSRQRRRPRGSLFRRLLRLWQDRRNHQPVLPEGQADFIEGRLKFDHWEDKQGGGKRSKLTVVVENFQFLGGREARGGGGSRTMPAAKNQTAAPAGRSAATMRGRAQARPGNGAASRRLATSSISRKTIFRFKNQRDLRRIRVLCQT